MCLHFLFTLTQWYKKWPQWAPNSSISGGYLERLEGEKIYQQRMMSYSTQSHKPSKFVCLFLFVGMPDYDRYDFKWPMVGYWDALWGFTSLTEGRGPFA